MSNRKSIFITGAASGKQSVLVYATHFYDEVSIPGSENDGKSMDIIK